MTITHLKLRPFQYPFANFPTMEEMNRWHAKNPKIATEKTCLVSSVNCIDYFYIVLDFEEEHDLDIFVLSTHTQLLARMYKQNWKGIRKGYRKDSVLKNWNKRQKSIGRWNRPHFCRKNTRNHTLPQRKVFGIIWFLSDICMSRIILAKLPTTG